MNLTARFGAIALAAAIAWLPSSHCAAYQQPPAASTTQSHRSAWGWLKNRVSSLQSAAKRQVTGRAGGQSAQAENGVAPAAGEQPGRLGWTFHNVDAASAMKRLERYGLKIPVDVQGRVTLRIRIGVPWRHMFTTKDYRLYGFISSDDLRVAGIQLDRVRANLSYVDGVLRLEQLELTTPDMAVAKSKVEVTGTAQVQLEPRGDLTATVDFKQLSLGRVLEQTKQAAGAASGEVSGHAQARAPIHRLRDLAVWNAQGRVIVSQLHAPGLSQAELRADLQLRDGAASLTRLSLTARDSSLTATGSARAQLQPVGNLTAQLAVAELEIEKVLQAVPQFAELATGRFTGNLQTTAPINRVQDVGAWQANATLSARDLRVAGLPPAQINLALRLANGTLTANRLAGDADFFHLEGSAQFGIASPFQYSANLRLTSSRVSRLNELKADFKLPIQIGGRLGASAVVQGALEPKQLSAHGGVTVRDLKVEGVAIDQLDFRYQADADNLQLHPVSVGLYGGTVSASAVVPFGKQAELKAGFRWQNLQIGPLAEQFAQLPAPLQGQASGALQVRLPMDALQKPAAWNVAGRADVRQLAFGSLRGATAGAEISLKQGTLTLNNLTAAANPMDLRGSAQLGVAAPYDFSLNLALGNADLALLNSLPGGVRPPWRVSGHAGLSARLNGSLQPLNVKGKGAILARGVRGDNLQLDSLQAKFAVDERQFRLTGIDAELYRGKVSGEIAVPMAQAAPASLAIAWSGLQLGAIATDLQLGAFTAAGHSHGKVDVSAPDGDLRHVAGWQGEAEAYVENLRALGWTIRQATLRARLKEGQVQVSELLVETLPRGGSRVSKLSGDGRLKLSAPYDFQAQLDLSAFDLSGLENLPPKFRPPGPIGGRVDSAFQANGALQPLDFAAQGSLSAARLQAGRARIESLTLKFAADDQSVRITELAAELYQGSISASAVYPLVKTVAGDLRVAVKHLDVGALLADVARLPVKLQGVADGKLAVETPPGALRQPAAWEVHASASAPDISVNSIRVGQVDAQVDYADARLDYKADGKVFSGSWEAAGAWRRPDENGRVAVNHGQVQIRSVQLGRLGAILRQLGQLNALGGEFNANLEYQHDENGLPIGKGTFEVDALRLNGVVWAQRIAGAVRVAQDEIVLEDLSGSIAGGLLRTSGTFYLSQNRRGQFRISLDGVDLNQLLAAWTASARDVRGVADIDLLAFVGQGRPWQFNGAASVREAELAGVPVNDVRAPVEGRFDPGTGHGEFYIRDAAAQVAFGHATASFAITSAGVLQIDGRGKFTDLDLHHLVRSGAASSHFGTGKITGNFTLAGRDVRSVNDLTGTIVAKLRDTQAAALPLTQTLQSYVAGGLTASSRFGSGDLRGRLARGVFRVERLSLSSSNVQVYATGNVSLAGRLNLSVVVNTGQINSTPALLLIIARLSVFVSPPVGLLLEANQFLSNQVIYLDITGTIHSPTVRVRPLPLLEEEAIRFFLLGAPIP